jgi:hypothetical protein
MEDADGGVAAAAAVVPPTPCTYNMNLILKHNSLHQTHVQMFNTNAKNFLCPPFIRYRQLKQISGNGGTVKLSI